MNGLLDVPLVVADANLKEQARRRLHEIAAKSLVPLRPRNVHVLRGGRAFEQICELARKIDIDLIVVSTRGLSGLKHFALGSTAERVVRYSPCPVLVIRPVHGRSGNGETTHTPLNVRKVLVPVDFSNCSHRGVEYAEHLAKQFRASIVLLHSVYFEYRVSSEEYARYDYPLFVQEADKAARVRMQELAREIESAGIKVEPLLKTGHVGEQICDRARAQGVDLIVTSTHGWTGFKHVLLGSNAEYVVQHATCPVLVVPTHQRPAVSLVGPKK